MAKKKSSNVVIKDEELTPTTLGVYSNKTKNPITLILLVAIFISVAIFMPNIQSYVNKMLGKSDTDANTYNNNGGSEGGGDVEPGDDEDENDKKYEIATTTTIDAKEYTLNNISLSGDTLSFSVYNKSNIIFLIYVTPFLLGLFLDILWDLLSLYLYTMNGLIFITF